MIHASSDPAASVVDVYVNDTLVLDDLAFNSGTNFFPVEADTTLKIDITPGNAPDNSAPEYTVTLAAGLAAGQDHIAVATGSLDVNAPVDEAFRVTTIAGAQLTAADPATVSVVGFHAAADAAPVSLTVDNATTPAVASLAFGAFTGDALTASYVAVDPATSMFSDMLLFDVRDAGTGDFLANFQIDSTALAGTSLVLAATGSVSDDTFGLVGFPATEGATPVITPGIALSAAARLQAIHNAADPLASSVDVYVNGTLYPALDDLDFRTATPFLSVPAETPLTFDITAPDAMDNTTPLFPSMPTTLAAGSTSIAIANGVLTPASFESAINTAATIGLNIFTIPGEESASAGNVRVQLFHGATDVGPVGLGLSLGALLFNTVSYGATTGYTDLASTLSIALTLTNPLLNDIPLLVTTTDLDLSVYDGATLTLVASGFLTPSLNSNGPDLAVLAVTAEGAVVVIPLGLPPV